MGARPPRRLSRGPALATVRASQRPESRPPVRGSRASRIARILAASRSSSTTEIGPCWPGFASAASTGAAARRVNVVIVADAKQPRRRARNRPSELPLPDMSSHVSGVAAIPARTGTQGRPPREARNLHVATSEALGGVGSADVAAVIPEYRVFANAERPAAAGAGPVPGHANSRCRSRPATRLRPLCADGRGPGAYESRPALPLFIAAPATSSTSALGVERGRRGRVRPPA